MKFLSCSKWMKRRAQISLSLSGLSFVNKGLGYSLCESSFSPNLEKNTARPVHIEYVMAHSSRSVRLFLVIFPLILRELHRNRHFGIRLTRELNTFNGAIYSFVLQLVHFESEIKSTNYFNMREFNDML